MNKLMNKLTFGVLASVVGLIGMSNFAHAAADTDLASSTELIKTGISDNKGTMLAYAAGVAVLALIIAGAFRLFAWGKGQILGSVPGRRKRR